MTIPRYRIIPALDGDGRQDGWRVLEQGVWLAPAIGRFRNDWRRRTVDIYPHGTDPERVITVGHPFDGGQPVICDEPRTAVARYIGRFDGVFE